MPKSHTNSSLSSDVTEAELSVLKTLWKDGPASIRSLTDALYPGGGASHYATVQKLLERLQRKAFVSRQPQGRANIYSATVEREELIAHRLQATADTLCGGSLSPLLTQLVGNARLNSQDLSALRGLMNRLESEQDESEEDLRAEP